MMTIPETEDFALVLRTDFSSDATWESLCQAMQEPVDGFQAYVTCISDRAFEGLTVEQLIQLAPETVHSFLFIVDQIALTHPERPILVVDLFSEPGRTFRVVPAAMCWVENNLSIANMDFRDFADNADPDGIFRGFPGVL